MGRKLSSHAIEVTLSRLLYAKETVQSCNRGYIVRLLYGKEAVRNATEVRL